MEKRFQAGERRFSRLEQRLNQISQEAKETKAHLQKQDVSIAEVATAVRDIQKNTQSMVDTWQDGTHAVKFFCRLAQAWRFVLRQVFLPLGLPGIAIYGVWYYTEFHRYPTWMADTFKFLMAVL